MRISKYQYLEIKENRVQGRYVTNQHLIDFLKNKKGALVEETIGSSVQNRPIKRITLGRGATKIFMWSQMHGNESTTTKAVLDLVNFLMTTNDITKEILKSCTIRIVPILNPDGAKAYTRFNAAQVDLNRDAQTRSQPESKVLRAEYDKFQPDFCFNLHDQRTIYNVGKTAKPATISFLAPAHDVDRTISKTRQTGMKLIAAMNETLQEMIEGQVGRYDDAFNANCVGDTFQMLNTPTILFEAGHFNLDYEREETRSYIFFSLIKALDVISSDKINDYSEDEYLSIPENGKQFFDILVNNVPVKGTDSKKQVGFLYQEILKNGEIQFIPKSEQKGDLHDFFGHQVYDYQKSADLGELKSFNLFELLNI